MKLEITCREMEVWQGTALGRPVKEICGKLDICRDTLWRYRQTVMEKLGVTNPVEMTLAAIAHGVIPVPTASASIVITPKGRCPCAAR